MKCISCSPCLVSKVAFVALLAATYFGACRFVGGESCPLSSGSQSEPVRVGTALGDIAPDFALPTVGGSEASLRSLNGSPSVLVFWTAWCPICKEEAPAINRLAAEFEPKGVKVIGINIGESDARINEGISDFGIAYTVAKDRDTSVARSFRVVGTPTLYMLDGAGVVQYVGHAVPHDYAERLNRMLGQ